MMAKFGLLEGVVFKQIDKQFLVYSSFSRETLIVHELAYKLLLLLKTHPQTDEELIRRLNLEQQGLENNAQEFVSLTLEQFSRLGIVEII